MNINRSFRDRPNDIVAQRDGNKTYFGHRKIVGYLFLVGEFSSKILDQRLTTTF